MLMEDYQDYVHNEKPTVDQCQMRKPPDDWNHFETRAFLYLFEGIDAVIDPSVLRVGFTGRLLTIYANEAGNYWPVKAYLWDSIFRKQDDEEKDLLAENSFKSKLSHFLATTSATWIRQQQEIDNHLLGRRLKLNNFYDDGVITCF